jgi:hypothetical protein
MITERLQELGAIDREAIEQRMGEQSQPQRQTPAPEQSRLPMRAARRPSQQGRRQRNEKQPVALRTVKGHVADGVAKINERV